MRKHMHLVACRGTSGMGQARAGDQETRRFGMIDRGQYAAIAQQLVIVDRCSTRPPLDQRCDRRALGDRRFGKFQHGAGLFERVQVIAVVGDTANPPVAIGHSELNKAHEVTFFP